MRPLFTVHCFWECEPHDHIKWIFHHVPVYDLVYLPLERQKNLSVCLIMCFCVIFFFFLTASNILYHYFYVSFFSFCWKELNSNGVFNNNNYYYYYHTFVIEMAVSLGEVALLTKV